MRQKYNIVFTVDAGFYTDLAAMFKIKIRGYSGELMNNEFIDEDYPLIQLQFTARLVNVKVLKPEANNSINKENRNLLSVSLPITAFSLITLGEPNQPAHPSIVGKTGIQVSPSMRHVISEIIECPFNDGLRMPYLRAKVSELLILVLSASTEKTGDERWTAAEKDAFYKIRDLISLNLSQNYSIEVLAEIAGMNRTKLQSGFKALFGNTIYGYTLALKMAEARRLLSKSERSSLKEITSLLGYSHTSHFSTAFKKHFSFSPSFFRSGKGEELGQES